jgi:hypothetical protein
MVGKQSFICVQNLNYCRSLLLVSVFKQQTDLPHLRVRKDMPEGGHSGEPNTISDEPTRHAGLEFANSNRSLCAVLLPQLRWRRVHVLRENRIMTRHAVTDGTMVLIYLCSRLIDLFSPSEGRFFHLPTDSGS